MFFQFYGDKLRLLLKSCNIPTTMRYRPTDNLKNLGQTSTRRPARIEMTADIVKTTETIMVFSCLSFKYISLLFGYFFFFQD